MVRDVFTASTVFTENRNREQKQLFSDILGWMVDILFVYFLFLHISYSNV